MKAIRARTPRAPSASTANVETRFWWNYSSITGPRTPPASFKLIDIHADTMELGGSRPQAPWPRHEPGGRATRQPRVDEPERAGNIRGLSSTSSFEIRARHDTGQRHLHIAPGDLQLVEISIRTLWNPEAHPLFTGLDNIDQRHGGSRGPTGPSKARSTSVGEGPASLYVARDDSGTEWEFRAKADGSMGASRAMPRWRPSTPTGNLVDDRGQVRHEPRVIWCAWGFQTESTGPIRTAGRRSPVINSRAVNPFADGFMYRPRSDNDPRSRSASRVLGKTRENTR